MFEIDIPDIANWNWSIEITFADVQLYFCPVDRAVLKFLNLRIKCKDSRHTHTHIGQSFRLQKTIHSSYNNTWLIDLTIHTVILQIFGALKFR